MDQEQPQDLRSLFAAAKNDKTTLEVRPDSNSEQYRSSVNAVIVKFEECQRQVQLLSLFSSNEPIEELPTGDLPYVRILLLLEWSVADLFRFLTVEYLLADLLQRSYSSNREAVLRRTLEKYEGYLMRMDDYGLLNDSNKKLYERYAANPSSFSLAPVNDAATRRELKVSRFREEKELKQKLEVG